MSEETPTTEAPAQPPERQFQHPEDAPWDIDYRQAIKELFPLPAFRQFQEETVQKIDVAFRKGARVVVVEAPTGSGKSPMAVTAGRKYPAYYATSQKLLQDQYLRDFSSDIVLLKGRGTYNCPVTNEPSDVAPCVQFRRRLKVNCYLDEEGNDRRGAKVVNGDGSDVQPCRCPYAEALDAAEQSQMTMFNYHAFHFQRNALKTIETGEVNDDGEPILMRVPRFNPRPLMILDEGHNVEAIYMDLIQLALSEDSAPGLVLDPDETTDQVAEKCRPPKTDKSGMITKPGGKYCQSVALQLLAEHESIKLVPNVGEGRKQRIQAFRRIQKLERIFMQMADLYKRFEAKGTLKDEWVLQVEKDKDDPTRVKKLILKPIYVKDFVPHVLFKWGARILILSATILDWETFVDALGLEELRKKGKVRYIPVPSTFPLKNRPIHFYPCGNLGFRTYAQDLPRVIAGIERVLELHPNERGIIHCHSWKILDAIRKAIPSGRLICQTQNDSREGLLYALESSKNGVIVAPAMHEGIDLKGDLSRFQIIVKVPYPHAKDPQIERRMTLDPAWYTWQTALKLVQATGRSVRGPDDWAITYVLDSGFSQFYYKASRILPSWFTEAVQHHNVSDTLVWLGLQLAITLAPEPGSGRRRRGL
jgi:Rad3-related DNA helicase